MPVSKKRKKDGKPVHRSAPAEQVAGAEHPEGHPSHPEAKSSKPKNPFVAHQPQVRGAQRGR